MRRNPDAHFAVSPVGAWLLLALTAPAASARDRHALEAALGLDADAAQEVAGSLLADPHPALAAAAAVWTGSSVAGEAVDSWRSSLPRQVEQGPIPSQAAADQWANDKTLGLVDEFPLALDGDQHLVLATALATALATNVTWLVPFDTVPSSARHGPWSADVDHLLRGSHGVLVRHRDVVLGVHLAWSQNGLTVLSVIGDPSLPRHQLLAAGQELAAARAAGRAWTYVDLWALPAGTHGFFAVHETSQEVAGTVTLPAWESTTSVDLLDEETLGFRAAGRSLSTLLRPDRSNAGPPAWQARQVTVARFNRLGFQAGAVTGMTDLSRRDGPFRAVDLSFDHPYAVVAYAGEPGRLGSLAPSGTRHPGSRAERAAAWPGAAWQGLPAFTAWVAQPTEPR